MVYRIRFPNKSGKKGRNISIKGRFASVAASGITFQAGSAAIDSATIMSALIFQLTGNPIAVGAVTAILRFGWLFPQLIVGFLAQRGGSSMRYYFIGAFGRASCISVLALTLYVGAELPAAMLSILVMAVWTAYAFISGIVAVPYNDIVARSVPSNLRSRLVGHTIFWRRHTGIGSSSSCRSIYRYSGISLILFCCLRYGCRFNVPFFSGIHGNG